MPNQDLSGPDTDVIRTADCKNLTIRDLSVHGAYLTLAQVNPQMHGILIDAGSGKSWQIAKYPMVLLAFADNSSTKFASVSGRATVADDRAKIAELWSPLAKAWWDSADDPAIQSRPRGI